MGRSYCIVSLKRLETTSPDLGAESGHYLLYLLFLKGKAFVCLG
jgi:hypothetical protein